MAERESDGIGPHVLRHPLVLKLAELTEELVGLQLTVVYPNSSGWGQARVMSSAEPKTDFCRLVQSTAEGAKHCRMCHILMAVAACSGGPVQQLCHAGASMLVVPSAGPASEAVAVLSSCTFPGKEAWKEAHARGMKLGIDSGKLRKAFQALPLLPEAQRRLGLQLMRAMTAAVQTVRHEAELESQVRGLARGSRTSLALEELLKNSRWTREATKPAEHGKTPPLLIHVVCELVRQRCDLPLTVKEIAAAARLTPNHFTSLFRRHTGQIFTEYLAEQRIERARHLLNDLTLSIGEVARRVGYDDPGYFARRFRQQTGLSPRECRERAPAPQK